MSDTPPRHELMRRAVVRERIAEHPMARQEAVVRHYTSLCSHALFMKRLMDERRYGQSPPELENLISRAEEMLVIRHVEDFGAKPSWWPEDKQ